MAQKNTKNEPQPIPRDVADKTVRQLRIDRDDGYLIVRPDYQRRSVWDRAKKTRLIESALLRIPLPAIYMSEEDDGKCSVIDGQQRLTAFFEFIDSERGFKLLSDNESLDGKKFADLSGIQQRTIHNCPLRTITFLKGADKNLKYEIFERLNSGAVSLRAQEMRNCVYHGPYNKLLHDLSVDRDYRTLMEFDKPHPRMWDVELVLRFAAFYFQPYMRYRPPIKQFLDGEMLERRNMPDEQQKELKGAFKKACRLSYSLLGENAFLRYVSGNDENRSGHWESAFNVSLYDILMGEFARRDMNLVMGNLPIIKEALLQLMTTDGEFIDSITKSTSSAKNVKLRFDKWRMMLDKILANKRKEPRCFSYQLKSEMFKANPICGICNQAIVGIDDAAVDHIEQYGHGGKTIPENARLTHRYCNAARSRKE